MTFELYIVISTVFFAIGIVIYLVRVSKLQQLMDAQKNDHERLSKNITELTWNWERAEEKVKEKQKQLEKAQQQLALLGNVDGLTGVSNREYFDKAFKDEWRRAFRSKRPVSLVVVNIDHFKTFNDAYGHVEGDKCLKKVTGIMKNFTKRPGDVVARLSDELFGVLLPETSDKGAHCVAERIRRSVETLGIPHQFSPSDPFVTVSCGSASLIPDDMNDPDALIFQSMTALSVAKKEGRNQVRN